MDFKSLQEIPFEIKYLFNEGYYPEDGDFMINDDRIDEFRRQWQELENQIIVKNLVIHYDSDGDEYHTEQWPYQIKLIDHPDCDITFEDDGLLIERKGNYIKFQELKNLSIGKFLQAMLLLNIQLSLTELGKKINNQTMKNEN